MKVFRSLTLLALSALTTLSVHAGSGVGNGGYSVVCRDLNTKQITSAEVLDMFEGRNLHYLEYSNNPVLKMDDYLTFSLNSLEAIHKRFKESVAIELKNLEAKIVYIPETLVLEPTNDAFPILSRKDCKFEQLATYTDDDKLYISKEIYSHLDEMNKAALRLHEAIYILARSAKQTNSKATRVIVSGSLALAPTNTNLIKTKVQEIAQNIKSMRVEVRLECGNWGTLENRINDCKSQRITKSGHEWILVEKMTQLLEPYIYIKSLYKAPNGTLVTSIDFNLKTLQGRKKRIHNAEKIIEKIKENDLCSINSSYDYFIAYPTTPKSLSLNMHMANFAEIRDLLQKFEGSEVLDFGPSDFYASEESLKDLTYDYFFMRKKFLSSKYKAAPVKELTVYNPISHRIGKNVITAGSINVICIE